MNTAMLRALDLFDRFVSLSGAARKQALDQLAATEPEVHQALQRLLASDVSPPHDSRLRNAFLDIPDGLLFREPDQPDTRLGQRMGPWRITGLLGTGGMGTVYEAERADGQYQQRVALKCIRQDRTSERLIEGFRSEREILASLDHPGIVPLLDGGIDADGHPWFAMRYVAGAAIDAWCDSHRANVRERVGLLLQACDALEYAHAQGVVHQDIKPSNLLVTDTGQVQLLDFGLSVYLNSSNRTRRLAVSHAYAAPEATTNATPTAAADIWSLGMVMYRLLAGALPRTRSHLMNVAGASVDEVATTSLSQLAAGASAEDARRRGCRTSAMLAQRLAGDLDAIALRCLAHKPADRFDSVQRLGADLRAWLDARPVAARSGGWGYRAGRFLVRHRLAAGLACVLVATIAGSLSTLAWKQRRADEAAEAARMMGEVFEKTLGTATLSGLGETPMSSRVLLQETEQRMRRLPLARHPQVLAQGLGMLARNHAVLGDYRGAAALAHEAASLDEDDETGSRTRATLAALLNLQGQPRDAARLAEGTLRSLPKDADPRVRQQVLAELARAHWHLANHAQARSMLNAAIGVARQADDAPAQAELLTQRAQWAIRLQRFADAARDTQHAVALAGRSHPLLASDARRVGAQNLIMQERYREGHALIERALTDYRALLGEEHPLVGRTLRMVAALKCSSGELDACGYALDRAEQIITRHYGPQHPEYAELLQVRALQYALGQGRKAASITLLRQAEALLRAAYPEDHNAVQHVRFMIARRLLYWPEASPQSRMEQLAEAIHRLESVQASFGRNGLPLRPLDRLSLADALEARGAPEDLQRARMLLEANVATLEAFPPTYSVYFRNDFERARLAYQADDDAAAARILDTLIPALERYLADPVLAGTHSGLSTDNNRRSLSLACALRGALLARAGKTVDARRWLVRSTDALATIQPEDSMAQEATMRLTTFDRTGKVSL